MIKIKANFQIQLAKIHELFSGQLKNEKITIVILKINFSAVKKKAIPL